MSTIRTGLTTVGLAALAVGAFNPAAALAAPTTSATAEHGSATDTDASAARSALAAPRLSFIETTESGRITVAGLAPDAQLVRIEVDGVPRSAVPVTDGRFATTVEAQHLGATMTMTAYAAQGASSPVEVVLEPQHAAGEDEAPATPVIHAVSDYDDGFLTVEGVVAHAPDLFAKTEVWSNDQGVVWDFPAENGAFSLKIPSARAGLTLDVTASYRGRVSEATPVKLVVTDRNTASDAHPLQLGSPVKGEVVEEPAPTFTGTGIPNSEIVVTRDDATNRSTATLCEARVAVSGDWSCTSAALPAGSYETTVTETPTWRSAPEQTAGAAFSVAADLLPGERPVTPQLSSVELDNTGELAVRVIAHNASHLRIEVDGEEIETVRGGHGRFTAHLDPALLGGTLVVTGLRGSVESTSLEVPLSLLEAPGGAPLDAPRVHQVLERDDERFTIYSTTNYFPDEFLVPGVIAKVGDEFVSSSQASWNGATFMHVDAEHAGEEIDLFTVRGDGELSPVTTVTLEATEGNTAPEVFPLDVVSPAEGETVAADTRTFSGEGIPGSRIVVVGDEVTRSAPLGAASVLADGTWTIEVDAPLAEGDHTMTVTETPYWENLAPIVSTRSFTVAEDGGEGETPAPLTPVTIATPADVTAGYTPDAPFTFTGTAEPGAEITVTNAKGLSLGAAVQTNDDGEWTWTRTNMGSYTWTMDFTAAAGSDREQATRLTGFAPRPATAAPVTINTPADVATGYAPDSAFTFGGTAEPGAEITVTNTKGLSLGAAVEVNDEGEWTWTRSNMGTYTWTMVFTADAGTDRQQAATLAGFAPRASTVAPVVVTNPADTSAGYTADESFTFEGTAEPGSELTVTNAKGLSLGAAVEVDEDGDWSWTRTNMGSYTWTMVFTTDADTDDAQSTRLTGFAPRS